MKNTIKYYYNLEIESIVYKNNKYYLDNYVLYPVYKEINMAIYNYIKSRIIGNYEIILNKDSNVITTIDKKNYVLLKKINNILLNYNNLEFYTLYMGDRKVIPWDEMWEEKIDYYEKHIKTIDSKLLKEMFHYYVGLTENAILLYKMVKKEENTFLSHSRLNEDDYLNPINYIIDYRVRDLAEYTKKLVFRKKLVLNDLFKYIKNNNYTNYEYVLLFIRLLYPSYYFDCYEVVVNTGEDNILNNYIDNIDNYEQFLNDVYNYLNQYVDIPKIDWLIKKSLSNDKLRIHPYQKIVD